MAKPPYMEMISEVMPVQRRDFSLDATTLAFLNPVSTNPLLDGEWLQVNSSYQAGRGGAGDVGVPSYQIFAERGRYDTQAIGKVPLLLIGGYEAETSICDPAAVAVNTLLIVGDVLVGGLLKKGLKKLPTATGQYWVAAVTTRLPASDKIRYRRLDGFLVTQP